MPPRPLRGRWRGRKASGRMRRKLSLDIGRATSAGQELSPLLARLAYSPAKISLEQLKIGQLESVTLDGAGNFDRVNATGWFALNSSAASLGRLTSLIVPFSPALAARLNAMGTSPGPARLKLALDLTRNAGQSDRVQARAISRSRLDRYSRASPRSPPGRPSRQSRASISPRSGAVKSGSSSKLSSEQGRALLALLGLDRTVAAGDGPAQFEGTATGAWGAPLRLKAKISGTGLEAEAEGSAEPWAPGGQGQSLPESSQRRFRAAARSQAGGYAGAEHRPVFARAAHRQQADLRRSRQQRRRFAPARQRGGDARRGEGDRGRNRRRAARAGAGLCPGARRRRTRCRRAARHRAGEGLARQDRVSGAARPACRAEANCSR